MYLTEWKLLISCWKSSVAVGHPPSGDLFALGSKSSRQSNSPSPLPPPKKAHLEESDDGGSSSTGSAVLFSDPIKIAQSRVGVSSESSSSGSSKHVPVSFSQFIEGTVYI